MKTEESWPPHFGLTGNQVVRAVGAHLTDSILDLLLWQTPGLTKMLTSNLWMT